MRQVHFEAEPTPSVRLDIRYEYRDALIGLGVLPRPRLLPDDPFARRERARGFAPDPFAVDPFAPTP